MTAQPTGILIVCKHSGLTFTAENRRRQVHPQIAYWTAHKDPGVREIARHAIAQGKADGLATYEAFQAAIEAAIERANSPEPPAGILVHLRQASRVGGYKKPWIARLAGPSEEYGYDRIFEVPYSKEEGATWSYALTELGVYEICNRNSVGDERRWFGHLIRTQSTPEELALVEIDEVTRNQLIGPPAEVKPLPQRLTLEQALAGPGEIWVEECWECGARYKALGWVEIGNMSCRRCS